MSTLDRTDRRVALGLALFMGAFYLLTTGAERPWGDGDYQYQHAHNVWVEHRLDLGDRERRWLFQGPDGRYYVTFALGIALSYGPSVAFIETLAPGKKPALLWSMGHRVASTIYGALAVMLLFLLARRLAVSRRRALGVALVAGVATQLWAYVHSDFSEAYQTFALTLAVYFTVVAMERPSVLRGVLLGLVWGHLALAKVVYLAILPVGFFAVLLPLWRAHGKAALRTVVPGVLAFLPGVAVMLGYNHVRTGQLLGTGRQFDHFQGAMDGSFLVGLHGLLLSSGKSVFLFSPILIAAMVGIPAFLRARPREARFVLATAVVMLLVYAKYIFWHGAWSFGPRFLTCLMPLLVLPLAFLRLPEAPRPRLLAGLALAGLLVASVGVQVLANSFYEGHHIHAQNRARRALLGRFPRDRCGWCHENQYPSHFVPHFSPIAVHWWLAKSRLTDADEATQRETAPWARFYPPKLRQKVEVTQPPFDWWLGRWIGQLRRDDTKPDQVVGAVGWVIVLGALAALLLGGWLTRPAWRDDEVVLSRE